MAITQKDAGIVMGMLARGDHNHHIASWFGENPGRVAEVKDGTAYGVVPAAPANELPPKGPPGIKGRRLYAYVKDAIKALESGDTDAALKELRDGIARFDQHES